MRGDTVRAAVQAEFDQLLEQAWSGLIPRDEGSRWLESSLELCVEAWRIDPEGAFERAAGHLQRVLRGEQPVPQVLDRLFELCARMEHACPPGADPEVREALKAFQAFVQRLSRTANREIWGQLQRHRRILRTQSLELNELLRLARASSGLRDFAELPSLVLARCARAFRAQAGIAWALAAPDHLTCTASYLFEVPDTTQCLLMPESEALALEALREQRPLWFNQGKGPEAAASLHLPLLGSEGPLGVLSLFRRGASAGFHTRDLLLAQSLSSLSALLLSHARLILDARQRTQDIETLFEAAQDISSEGRDLKGVLCRLLERSLSLLSADSGFIALLRGDRWDMPAAFAPGPVPRELPVDPGSELVARMRRARTSIPLSGAAGGPDEQRSLLSMIGASTGLVVPLLLDERLIGALVIGTVEPRSFSEEARNLAQSLAYLGALAVRNVSHLETLEEEVSSRTRALEEANQKLRVLDQIRRNLLSNVTHELRTPLSGIIGYGEILEEELATSLTPEQQAFMHQILSEGYHLRDLINTMIDMSQLASGALELDRQPVSLELLVQQACDQFRPLAQAKGQALRCEVAVGIPFANADPSRTYQVLGHLMTNALKFTPEGGEIIVRVVQDPAPERPMLRVEVEDTGIGIPADKFPLLFMSFFQADPSATRQFGGMGLGLSLSKSLVELHGGRIWAESKDGEGSIFRFTLPAWGD